MLIPQSDRKKIFEHLFEDGVCIAKKDYNMKSHPEIKGVRNLYVIKALKVWLFKGCLCVSAFKYVLEPDVSRLCERTIRLAASLLLP